MTWDQAERAYRYMADRELLGLLEPDAGPHAGNQPLVVRGRTKTS